MPRKTRWSDMRKDRIPFSTLREQFRVYNKASGKSPGTVRWYEQALLCFERWLGPEPCLADLDIHAVRRYVAELQERTTRHVNNPLYKNHDGPLSSSYIQGNVRALRAFASWLHADGYTDANVLRPLKPPKVQTKVVEVLTDDEVRRLVAVFDRDEPYGARGYAIVWTLCAGTSARRTSSAACWSVAPHRWISSPPPGRRQVNRGSFSRAADPGWQSSAALRPPFPSSCGRGSAVGATGRRPPSRGSSSRR